MLFFPGAKALYDGSRAGMSAVFCLGRFLGRGQHLRYFRRQMAFTTEVLNHAIQKVCDDSRNRNAQKHSHRASCITAYCDGENNPDRLKAGGITKNFGAKDITTLIKIA